MLAGSEQHVLVLRVRKRDCRRRIRRNHKAKHQLIAVHISWNDMLSYGQTTITEGWNTCYDTGDGTYAVNGSMNHFGLGTVGQWLYSDVLGIQRYRPYARPSV